jgi:hypothetical protein
MELKSLFIDCNDQLAPVWQRVVRAEIRRSISIVRHSRPPNYRDC